MFEIRHRTSGQLLKLDVFWLRDHCRCTDCYNVHTKQRKYNLLDIPVNITASQHDYAADGSTGSDGHQSVYDIDFLYASQMQQRIARAQHSTLRTAWNRAVVLQNEPKLHVTLPELISSDAKLKEFVSGLIRYGIMFVDNVPSTTTMTELAIRRVFPVMKTFFGEMYTFSDKHTENHADTAYTKEYLGAHTDNTYFCDAAGLQILHCIQHDGTGGENFFVDGLHAVLELKRRNVRAFELLSTVLLPAEYIEDGEYHKHMAPVIRIDPLTADLQQVRLNVYDRAVFDTLPQALMSEYYASLREFLQIVQSAENKWDLKLQPGTVVFFDNWRVCHGRLAYTGQRTMTGCYVQRTDYLSKARVLGIID